MSFAGIVMKEYYHDDNHHFQQQQTLRTVCWLYFSSSPSWWWSSRLWELSGLVCWRPTGIHLSRLISSNLDTLLLQSDHHHHHCQSFHWKNVFKAQCHTRPQKSFWCSSPLPDLKVAMCSVVVLPLTTSQARCSTAHTVGDDADNTNFDSNA